MMLLASAGCSNEPDSGGSRRVASTSTSTSGPSSVTTATEAPQGPVIEVELSEDGFLGLPDEVDVGTRIGAVNRSEAEMHEFIAFRLPDGETRSSGELAALSDDDLVRVLGAAIPDVIQVAPPGESAIKGLGDAVFEVPGRYLVLCTVPVGADPALLLASDRYTTGRWPDQYQDSPSHAKRGEHDDVIVR